MSTLIDLMYANAKRRLERSIDYHTRVELLGFKDRCNHYVIANCSTPTPDGWPLEELFAHYVFAEPRHLRGGPDVDLRRFPVRACLP